MGTTLHIILAALLKVGFVALVLNEIRGLVLAAPVIWGIYKAGGEPMAIWIGICTLAGIALTVIVPLIVAKKAKRFMESRASA